MTAHAFAVLDAYVYGFALEETSMPVEISEELAEMAEIILQQLPADEYPYLAELTFEHVMQPGYA